MTAVRLALLVCLAVLPACRTVPLDADAAGIPEPFVIEEAPEPGSPDDVRARRRGAGPTTDVAAAAARRAPAIETGDDSLARMDRILSRHEREALRLSGGMCAGCARAAPPAAPPERAPPGASGRI